MSKTSNRGPSPSCLTKYMLIAKAGGRCQFSGCNKTLFIDSVTLAKFNNTNIAHIVASAPDGPRGNDNSIELSDKLENLMLLCQEHHALIDSRPEEYTIKRLIDMKEKQEQEVEFLLNGMNYPKVDVVLFEAPIKNKIDINIDYSQAVSAVRSNKKNPASTHGIIIKINCSANYKSEEYWNMVEHELKKQFRYTIFNLYQNEPNLQLAIFPLAPIPLIAKLGSLLGDKKVIDIYQKFRIPDTWNWLENKITNSFVTERLMINKGKRIALVISLTAEIDFSRVTKVFESDIIYHIRAKRIGVDCIKSLDDLKAFWQEFQLTCDHIKNNDRANRVSVFPAMPVSAAFELGRRHMPAVHPILEIYDDDDGFFKTLEIGGTNND